jgi:DNA (cytosine-5)-methyltransferase 1
LTYKTTTFAEPSHALGTVAELFAGVGGFRIGLARAGFSTIFSNQWEPSTKAQPASSCYEARFGALGHSNEDIAAVVSRLKDGSESIPATDLLVGGFPCQDYSVAKTLNSSKGLEGKKGVLWWEIRSIVEINKPKFVFLENVDRLLKSPSSQRGRDFAIMLKTLGDLGYLVEWRVVNAAEIGFPQRRIRVFIIARRADTLSAEFQFSAESIIGESGVLARAFPVNQNFKVTEVDVSASPEELTTNFGKGLKISPFMNSGTYYQGRAYTARVEVIETATKATLGDVVIPDDQVPESYWIPESRISEWEYLKGSKTIQRVHKESGVAFNYSEGKMAFPDLLSNPARTIITGEGGTSPSRFKHVIKTNKGYRRLTPLELERLNGFPDNWTQFDASGTQISDVKRAFFMGNALVVGLIERVGHVLADELKKF